jgi:hypothetical protein
MSAPSATRTRDLLLRSNPAVDAVAISDGAGQVRGSAHCCRPSYLVIASRALGARSPPGTRYGSRPGRGSQPAYRPWPTRPCLPPPQAATARPAPSTHVGGGPGGFLSRPRSRTDERARCPQWFSAVSAVSDRTGSSTASNWSQDLRSTVRPAQRSLMPMSGSCRSEYLCAALMSLPVATVVNPAFLPVSRARLSPTMPSNSYQGISRVLRPISAIPV